jgi:hypothetical protein
MGKYVERGSQPPHAIMADDPPAIVLIKEEHQMFRALFDRAEEEEGPPLVSLTAEICVRLAIHMMFEEDVLYPALKPAIGLEKIDEGIVEHDLAKTLIVDLVHMTGGEELYKSKVHVLGEEVMHHIDEEDGGLLEDARKAWEKGRVDLPVVSREMSERRQELYDVVATMGSRREPEIEPVGEEIDECAGTEPRA